jgi:hypothetical protein
MRSRHRWAGFVGALMLVVPVVGWAQGYRIVPLQVPGCVDTQATGINDKQQIVVVCYDAQGVQHAGLWRTDWWDPLIIPGALDIGLSKTNNKRRTVGNYWYGTEDSPAFKAQPITEQKDAIFHIEIGAAWAVAPLGINDHSTDEIAGAVIQSPLEWGWRGFVRTLDPKTKTYTFHDILPPAPGYAEASAWDVNTAQLVVGTYTYEAPTGGWFDHGFLYHHKTKTYQTFDVPGAEHTHLTGINDKGQLCGYYWDGARWRGFVWTGSALVGLDAPHSAGAGHTFPMDINNQGQVVGWTQVHSVPWHESFRADPVGATVAGR